MSTAKTDMKVELEWKKITHIIDFAFPEIQDDKKQFLKSLTFAGCEPASTIFELAISKCGNLHHEPTDGRDFSDGSDAKLVGARLRGKGSTVYSARVDNKNKDGYLRIGVYERVRDKMYYFLIPPELHTHHKSLEIKFNGTTFDPDRSSKGANWWAYEVKTISDVSAPVNSLQSDSHTEIKIPVFTRYTVTAKQKEIEEREKFLSTLFGEVESV